VLRGLDNVQSIKIPCYNVATHVKEMPKSSYFLEPKEEFFLLFVWITSHSCGLLRGILVEHAKIEMITNLPTPYNVKNFHSTLGNPNNYK
jgi:hypothetical protein